MKKQLLLICFLSITMLSAFSQTRNIRGRVTSAENGESLIGVTISVKGTSTGTLTDIDGNFSLKVPDTGGILAASFVGMKTIEMPLTGEVVYDFVLEHQNIGLDEVVVTALGVTREKKTLGYAVQELSSDDFNMANDANIVNSLSGKVAGVQVTSGGSTVGASSRIVIRGNATFSGNSPLFVIDGTPISNTPTNLGGAGGVDWGNGAADIDPNNIESMTILKGANAAALYGSRASNGVILITTKKGGKGKNKLGVDISSSYVIDKPSYFPALQNEYGGGWDGSEYIYNKHNADNGTSLTYNDYAKQFSYNYVDGDGGGVSDGWPINWGPRLDAGLKLDQWSTGPNSPWVSRPDNVKQWFNNGVNRETSASFYSNGEKASGRITYTNLDSEGIVDFTDQRQNTISANINLTPNSKLTTTANVTYLRKESDNIPAASYSKWADIFGWLQRDYPTQYAKDLFYEKGNEDYIFPGGDNPFYGLRNTNELSRERMFGNISTTYKINDWLSASARIGVDSYHQKQKRITQSGTKKNIRQGKGGQFEENKNSFRETNADITLNFDKTFGDYRVDGLIGANNRNTVSSWSKMKALDLTVADIYSISNVNGTPELGMSSSEYETQSIYASVNSSYKDYLYLGLTYRLDWSSTLPPDNWSFPYYSISTGLDLTNALDLESNLLSYAKLRGSIAKVGGDTGPYQLVKTYSGSFYNSISKYNPLDILPENNLMPEETVSYEFGADLRLLDDRISVDVTYYNQNTVNQILDIKTSTTTGYAAMKKNAAEVSNKGVELMVFGKVLENKSGLNWDVTLNWATNKSIVKSLWGNLESYVISTGFGGAKSLGIPGEEWGVIWGLPFVRNDAGKVVVDSRGIPKTAASGQKLGTITPDWTGGITNSFRYKGVNLSFMVDAKMGGDFFSCSAWHSYPTGSYEVTTANNVRETGLIVDGVFEDGTPNDVRVSAQDYYGGGWMWNNHEYSVLDGSYIKLREFVLGYNFDVQQIKWIQKLNISLVGRNLAILYQDKSTKDLGLDPEVGFGGTENGVGFENFQIPTSRSFGIKLKVSF